MSDVSTNIPSGVGLGFRRDIAHEFLRDELEGPAFVELAPENWIDVGGYWGKTLRAVSERYPMTCHGLSLSIGSPEPLDLELVTKVKQFLRDHSVAIYSEHLSYSKCNNAHLYDLLPIPFRADAVKHVASRIKQVQEILERPLLIENVSYYTPVAPEMDEATFIRSIVEESNCKMLLDVNNVYVNSVNHCYDAKEFLLKLPLERVEAMHIAGHERRSEDLIIDTHGAPIIDPVYDLFEWTIKRVKSVPVLLERDFNFPQFAELQGELSRLQAIVDSKWRNAYAA